MLHERLKVCSVRRHVITSVYMQMILIARSVKFTLQIRVRCAQWSRQSRQIVGGVRTWHSGQLQRQQRRWWNFPHFSSTLMLECTQNICKHTSVCGCFGELCMDAFVPIWNGKWTICVWFYISATGASALPDSSPFAVRCRESNWTSNKTDVAVQFIVDVCAYECLGVHVWMEKKTEVMPQWSY